MMKKCTIVGYDVCSGCCGSRCSCTARPERNGRRRRTNDGSAGISTCLHSCPVVVGEVIVEDIAASPPTALVTFEYLSLSLSFVILVLFVVMVVIVVVVLFLALYAFAWSFCLFGVSTSLMSIASCWTQVWAL